MQSAASDTPPCSLPYPDLQPDDPASALLDRGVSLQYLQELAAQVGPQGQVMPLQQLLDYQLLPQAQAAAAAAAAAQRTGAHGGAGGPGAAGAQVGGLPQASHYSLGQAGGMAQNAAGGPSFYPGGGAMQGAGGGGQDGQGGYGQGAWPPGTHHSAHGSR